MSAGGLLPGFLHGFCRFLCAFTAVLGFSHWIVTATVTIRFDSARGKPPDPHYSITRNTNTITYSRAQFRLYTAVSYLAPLLLYCVLFAKANNIEVAPVTGLGSSAQGWMVTVSLPLGVRVQSIGLDGRKLCIRFYKCFLGLEIIFLIINKWWKVFFYWFNAVNRHFLFGTFLGPNCFFDLMFHLKNFKT